MKRAFTFFIILLLAPAAVLPAIANATTTGPDAQTLLQYTQHFKEPAKGPEFVMPVGSGDLSALVSYDSALQLHFSKSDWLGHPVVSPQEGAQPQRNPGAMSPGHLTVALGNLTAADIRSFDQYMDFGRGSVVVKIGTDAGPVELEVFGDMTRKALLIHVRDGRAQRGNAAVQFTQWREAMKIAAEGARLTGEEIHPMTLPLRDNLDVVLYKLGLGVAVGSKSAQVKEGALEITAAKSGDFQVVVTAQVTRDGKPLVPALAKLNELLALDTKLHRQQQLNWWKAFWEQSWVEMKGDKDAEYLTRLWLTDLYTFAGIFGGWLPPTFNGSSMLVMKDYSSWVGLYTWQNTRELIWPMGAANRLGYADLYFRTLDRYFPVAQEHALNLGKTGIRLPENVNPWQDPGNRFNPAPVVRKATPFDRQQLEDQSNQKFEQGAGSFTSHILQDGAELVQLMLDHVRYTGDEKFLKEVCAPWLRESTLFYLKYLKQGGDGLWHMIPSNAAETWWKVKDPMTDMCGVRYCLEQVVKHGQEFGYEPELVAMVRERLEKLAPIPVGRWKERKVSAEEIAEYKKNFPKIRLCTPMHFDGIDRDEPLYSPATDIGEYPSRNNFENPELYIVFPYARVGMDSPAADLQRGINTFKERKCLNSYGWSPDGVQAARLGLPDTADVILHHAKRQQTYPYGGWRNAAASLPGAVTKGVTDTPQLDTAGVNMTAIQEMLLQSHDLAAAEQLLDGGPIRLLPAIRKNWSGNFKLRARGGFLVTCAFENGAAKRVEILSQHGRRLQVVNPFAEARITGNGKELPASKDRLISLPTKPGETVVLTGQP
jgi:hypothetical protein